MEYSTRQNQVSVIVLCYNTGSRLRDTFKSIKNQRFQDYELIITDDCSTDNSVAEVIQLLEELELQAVLIRNEVNIGIAKSLNKALSVAQGRFIAIIGDDIWHGDYLSESIAALSGENDYNFVFSRCETFNKVSDIYEDGIGFLEVCQSSHYPRVEAVRQLMQNGDVLRLPEGILFDILFWVNPVVAFCTVINRQLLLDVGGFDEGYIMEDLPTWFNLSRRVGGVYINKILGTYIRYHANTSSQFAAKINEDALLKKKTLVKEISYSDTKRMVLNRIIDYIRGRQDRKVKKTIHLIYWYLWKAKAML